MPEGKDFFISYTGADKQWAEWIAKTLKAEGFTVRIQLLDFGPGKNFVLEMHKAAQECTRTMPVYSPDYFKALFTHPEWAAAFVIDPTGKDQRLVPVRVRECKPDGILKPIVYIDLVGLKEPAAKEKLLHEVNRLPALNVVFPGEVAVVDEAKTKTTSPEDIGFVHNLPFDSNPLFTGREKMQEDLHAALQRKTAAAITQPQAVHGLGGVGKTQLAIEYAWRHKADYDAVLWVVAETPSELHAKMAALAGLLKLSEAAATQQEVKVEAVVEWLRSHQRWLLLLDNVDSKQAKEAVLKLLPSGLPGHVMVTSRLAEWPVGYGDVEVTVLPDAAAKEFLIKRAHKGGSFNPGGEADALAVAKELGCLPLALEQAGAYIARHHISFVAYLGMLKESRAKLLEFPSQGGTGYQKTVATTWLVSEPHLSLTARAILQMSAFLAPDDIPRALFCARANEVAKAVLLLDGGAKSETEDRIRDALAELGDYSLIELDDSTFSCHRLVQAALLNRLKTDERQRWAEATLKLVNKYAPARPSDVRTWPVWDILSPHASALLKEFWSQTNSDASDLMNELGQLLDAKALFGEAEPLMRRALTIDEKSFGPEHPNVAIRLNNLAQLLKATNRLGEAEPLMLRALKIFYASLGLEHPDTKTVLGNYMVLLEEMKLKPEEIEGKVKEVIETRSAERGTGNGRTS